MEELRDCWPLSRALRWLRLTARALNREGQALVGRRGPSSPHPQPNQGRPSAGQGGVQRKEAWVLLRRLLL